jgi:hypothetical protein
VSLLREAHRPFNVTVLPDGQSPVSGGAFDPQIDATAAGNPADDLQP